MPRPSRARRILRWTGATLSLVILSAWVVSLWGELRLSAFLYVNCGRLEVPTFAALYAPANHRSLGPRFRPHAFYQSDLFELGRRPGYVGVGSRIYYAWIVIPLWLLLLLAASPIVWPLLTAIPTAWLWHRDRRLFSCSPDHLLCSRCGYDLTGNTSGVCSECGLAKRTVD